MDIKSKLGRVKLVRRNQIPVEELEPGKCENCGYGFKGHFCPNCGQEVAEFNRPFGFILYDFVGNFFAFDTRFFRTFKYLLIRPGFLTSEFFQGRRVRYSPPFRIFVFLSFVLFLFLQLLTERSLDFEPARAVAQAKERDSSFHVRSSLSADSVELDSVMYQLGMKTDSLNTRIKLGKDSSQTRLNIDFSDILFTRGKLRDKQNLLGDRLEDNLKQATDPKDRLKLKSYIAMCRNPELVISNILKYLSWSFFILLPLFALVLKLFYVRRKQNYIRHLIFSIHLHSFLFFILVIISGARLVFDSGMSVFNSVLLLSFPVYFILALRNFYGQGIGKVILKFIGISVIYNVMLWSAVMFVFLKSIQII